MTRRAVRIEHGDPHAASILMVDWHFGTLCNYACSYCPDALHDGAHPWPTEQTVRAFVDQLVAHAARLGKQPFFKFTGGEPTLCPYFLDLVAAMHEKGCLVGVNSNGTKGLKWWGRAREVLDEVNLTYHFEFAKEDRFVEVARTVAEKTRVHVLVTMHPAHFDRCRRAAERVARECTDLTVTMKPLREGFGEVLYDYSEEQREVLAAPLLAVRRTRPKEPSLHGWQMRVVYDDGAAELLRPAALLARGEARFAGWTCHVGLELLVVTAGGRVVRANCRQGGVIGRLGTTIAFPDEPVVCKKLVCACLADISSTRDAPAVPSA
jgi:organic radical activating enzyme